MSEQSQPAGSGPAGPAEDNEPASAAPRPRRNLRGGQVGAALTSRSAGWIVAAALAGSLATYLFAPPRTTPAASVGVAYQSARPVPVQRGARVAGPAGNARVQAPAGAPGAAEGSVPPPKRIAVGSGQIALPPGQVSGLPPQGVVVPGPGRAYFAAPSASHGRVQVVMPGGNAGGPAAGQVFVGPGGNWVGAPMPACAFAGPGGLPGGHRMSIRLARPGALKRILSGPGRRPRISWVRVAPPQRVVIVRPPASPQRVVIVRPPAGRRTVVVGPGWRSVRTPRQIRLGLRPGKRLTVIRGGVASPGPWSAPTCVFVGPSR